jgi:hypothetical protein
MSSAEGYESRNSLALERIAIAWSPNEMEASSHAGSQEEKVSGVSRSKSAATAAVDEYECIAKNQQRLKLQQRGFAKIQRRIKCSRKGLQKFSGELIAAENFLLLFQVLTNRQ